MQNAGGTQDSEGTTGDMMQLIVDSCRAAPPQPCPTLPPEVEEGNTEYKLTLKPNAERLQRLITQLHWRLGEGAGEAQYVLGVTDWGYPEGLSATALAYP